MADKTEHVRLADAARTDQKHMICGAALFDTLKAGQKVPNDVVVPHQGAR